MILINKQYDEKNNPISTLWKSTDGKYFIEKNGIFTEVVEAVKPTKIELTEEQIRVLQNLYRKEMVSEVTEIKKNNPIQSVSDEVINKIS